MPKIQKQTAQPAPAKTGTIVDQIESLTSRSYQGLKFVIYGRSKTGKTRLACTFPKPLLIIGTEDGTKSVANVKGVDFVRIRSSVDLEQLIGLLATHKYKSCCLDTAGGYQDIVTAEVLNLKEIPVQKSWGMADKKEWGAIGIQFKERMRRLTDLADSMGLNQITIAHERNFKEEEGEDLMLPSVGAALTPTAAAFVNGAHDYICQTFIREEKVESQVTVGDQQVAMLSTTGKKEYCLRVGPHSVYMTGFRVPLGVSLPDVIVDPHYDKLMKLIKGQ